MRPSFPPAQDRQQEPESLRHLSRSKLYKHLSETYFLPKLNSRAITRSYLIGVYLDKYFRVRNSQIKQVLCTMTPSDLERANFVTVPETVAKLDALLKEKDQKSLGFNGDFMPDVDWLFQVARCVDPSNSAGFFKKAIEDPKATANDSDKVLLAQQAAEKALLEDHGLLGRRDIMDSLQSLSDSNRQLRSHLHEESLLMAKWTKAKDKVKKSRAIVEEKLTLSSLLVLNGIEPEPADLSSFAEADAGRARKLLKVRET
jgi:hypothetical protein